MVDDERCARILQLHRPQSTLPILRRADLPLCRARAHSGFRFHNCLPHHFLALSLPLSAQLLISPQRRTSPAASSRMTHCAAAAPRSPKSSAAAPKIRTGSGGSPAAHVETGAHPHVVHPDRRPGCRPSRGGRRRGAHRSRGRGS